MITDKIAKILFAKTQLHWHECLVLAGDILTALEQEENMDEDELEVPEHGTGCAGDRI